MTDPVPPHSVHRLDLQENLSEKHVYVGKDVQGGGDLPVPDDGSPGSESEFDPADGISMALQVLRDVIYISCHSDR